MDLDADARLARFAASHHGVFRGRDARRLGMSERQLGYRVGKGLVARVARSVYVMTAAPRTRAQAILIVAWASGGVVSHRTAAELHDLWRQRHPPEVTVGPSAMHHVEGGTVHRSRDLDRARVVTRNGIRCTDVARTLVDIGSVTSTRTVESLVHTACHRRLTSVDELVATYLSVSRRGRHGCGPIREVLASIDPIVERADSELEVVLLTIIRQFGLPEPEVQHEVAAGVRTFRLDVAYPEHRLFIEGDGFGVHGTRSAFESDRWRQNLLVLEGWRVLRFTWRQLLQRPAEVAAHIRRALQGG